MERTFLMVKPDAVKRGLIGEIIKRIEKAGLKIVAMKMALPTREFVNKFYPSDEEWLRTLGEKAKKGYESKGLKFKWNNLVEYGKMIKGWLVDFITSGPVVAMVIEGPDAIRNVRDIVGNTEPRQANPGTIRGDFSVDSYDLANAQERVIRNLVHASGNEEEAKHEIKLWFKPEEIVKYKRVDEELMFEK